jgi:hypothetical protein
MTDPSSHRANLSRKTDELTQTLLERLTSGEETAEVVASPPGAGKTRLLVRLCVALAEQGKAIGVVCQTNQQVNDVAKRLVKETPDCPIIRFLSSTASFSNQIDGTVSIRKASEFPDGKKIVVGTSAKWSLIEKCEVLDALLIDEAWQMTFSTFLPIMRFTGRFLIIGDPGQLPPVVTTSTERWATSAVPPHKAAPELLLRVGGIQMHQLPATWRLPHDSAKAIAPFYDFAFESAAQPTERRFSRAGSGPLDDIERALSVLNDRSTTLLLVSSPSRGTLATGDREVAAMIAQTAVRALETGAVATSRDRAKPRNDILLPQDIGITASRREMVRAIRDELPSELRTQIRVDTAERWQGSECELMIIAHPLSSVRVPSEFDLATGRLCVMASRHRCGLIIVTRDHVPDTLAGHMPSATQPLGQSDTAGRGLFQHRSFWEAISA